MKIRCEHDVFSEAVTWAARTIPTRPSLPILSGIKLDASEDGTIALSSYDPDITSYVEIFGEVIEPGTILIHGRLLSEYVRALPKQQILLSSEGGKLDIVCGSSRMSMTSMPIEDYPQQAELNGLSGTINGADFHNAVAQTVVAASNDDTLPLLVSLCIEIKGEKISLTATDRYRLAISELSWKPEDPTMEAKILVRGSRLSDIAKSLGTIGDVKVTLDTSGRTGMIGFEASGRKNIARLIDGDYPQVRQLFPDSFNGYAVVDRIAMLDALKRARLVVEKHAAVVLNFVEGQLILRGGQNDNAQTSEEIEAYLSCDPITMAFNPSYLQDGLTSLSDPYVRLSFTSESRPVVITGQDDKDSEDNTDYRLLLMPIHQYK
ncbi:DNA polymerase III subunit beta [Actinotignum urinale]|uniref:DNA polymerase III subunit beta n=1 Tax=Actinotignum urinale TaxID=190146 RepID=UPI00370D03ED